MASRSYGHLAHIDDQGEPTDLAGWQKQIEADHTEMNGKGDFNEHKSPEEGFIDLDLDSEERPLLWSVAEGTRA
jgi:hypothetical protein